MYTLIDDNRNLGIILIDPISGKTFNKNTQTITPFNPSTCIFNTTAVNLQIDPVAINMVPSGLFSNVKYFDDGNVMINNTRLVPYLVTVDGSGHPVENVDIWSNPFLAKTTSVRGGFGSN